MKMHLLIRRFAGTFILASLLLAHYHSPNWLWLTAFVGFNLLQSSFTNFCPWMTTRSKAKVRYSRSPRSNRPHSPKTPSLS